MIAAHTLLREGVDSTEIDIFTDSKTPSVIGGAQYLHSPIIDADSDGEIATVRIGRGSEYAFKVYGDKYIDTSWNNGILHQKAWNLRFQYSRLWKIWQDRIVDKKLINGESMKAVAEDYLKVFSSVPAVATCRNVVHKFPSMKYVLVEKTPLDHYLDNIVIYNGRPEDNWYRYSSIFGHQWLEYTKQFRPMTLPATAVMGEKPLGTNCDCCTSLGVIPISRGGTWNRKVLLHNVSKQVYDALH